MQVFALPVEHHGIDITDQGITVTSEHRKIKIHTNDESVILASAFARQPNVMERVLA
jgi:hypothetical protein